MSTKTKTPTQAKNPLSEKAVLAGLTIRHWTGRKLDRQITDEVNQQHDAAADAGRYNKLLVPREVFADVYKIVSEARSVHHVMTLPWFDEGARILPAASYDKFATRFRELRSSFNTAADAFARAYPTHVTAAETRLNGMFKAEDYPAPERVRGMFDFNVTVLPCPNQDDFRVDLAKEHLTDVRHELEGQLKAALEDAMKEPVRRIIAVVEKMAERLKHYKPATDNTKAENTFRDSLVTNIRDLVELLPPLNLTSDAALTGLITRMEQELCSTDAQTLREDERARRAVAQAAEDILQQANTLMA